MLICGLIQVHSAVIVGKRNEVSLFAGCTISQETKQQAHQYFCAPLGMAKDPGYHTYLAEGSGLHIACPNRMGFFASSILHGPFTEREKPQTATSITHSE